MEKSRVPDRVAAKDKARKDRASELSVVRVDCDWGSSGLWDEQGRMIPYDYIDLPLPFIRRIVDWHEKFDATLDEVTSGTGPCDEWDKKHELEKRKIALELQKTLGSRIVVQVGTAGGWIPIMSLTE